MAKKKKAPRKPKAGTTRLNFVVSSDVVKLLDSYAQQLSAELEVPVSRTAAFVRLVRKNAGRSRKRE